MGTNAAASARVRVLPPDADRLPPVLDLGALDPVARSAADALVEGRDVLVHAAPGAGRTVLALAAALAASPEEEGEEVLLLAPRRNTADPLRDAVALAGHAHRVRVATPAAYAHAVVRAEARDRGIGEATLVTGAEQDALLKELVGGRTTWVLDIAPAGRTLPGFRDELRDVITRATELGLRPRDLRALAHERGRPAWEDAAALYEQYLDVLDLEASAALDAGPRLDSGSMVRGAADRIPVLGARRLPRAVVVDDAQDLTAAGCALVRAMARTGIPTLVTSCPDEMVDSFRGALPDAANRIMDHIGREPLRVHLTTHHRRGGAGEAALETLRSRLPLAGAPAGTRRPHTGRAAEPAAHPGDGIRLSVLTADDELAEARIIASALRDLHHGEHVPYDDMAVICRSGAVVEQVADLLERHGLRVTTPQRLRPLREERVVADLLRILELGTALARVREHDDADATELLDPTGASELLRGPFGDVDTLRLRRIRRLLLDVERADPSRTPTDSGTLLARALTATADTEIPETRDRAAAPVHRIRRMIRAVRDLGPGAAAADALWAAWDAARVAEGWQRAALGEDMTVDAEDARARLTARRLDAIGALFAAAERFTERRGTADALVFIEHIRSQSVAEDTLAPRAEPRGRIAVLTPAQIAGTQRDTVVLARVQDGAWPNTRLRSTLFGAAELSLVAGRGTGAELPLEPAAMRAIQREQVIADELRLAVSALARARSRILVTAVAGAELHPSVLLDLLGSDAQDGWVRADAADADPGPAPDARRLVGALRTRLARGDAEQRAEAALLLDELARAGAPGADPSAWYHQRPSSEQPLVEKDTDVRLSPSALERAHACPQAWLLERAGGSRPPGGAQQVGTAIHRLAQEHPAGVPEHQVPDLLARLHTLLRPLDLESTWSGRRRLRQADEAAARLQDYLRTAPEAPFVEAGFEYRIGRLQLRGAIDRIEGPRAGDPTRGDLRVVDIKTGRAPKTAADAESDLQLAAYQGALRAGAFSESLGEDAPERMRGAQLVYVGTGAARPPIRTQSSLREAEDGAWFDEITRQVAGDVSGDTVQARRNAHCDHCAVRRSCGLWPQGAEL